MRGLIIGGTAIAGAVGSVLYPVGSWMPEALVGPKSDAALGGGTAVTGSRTVQGDSVGTPYGNVQVEISATGTHIDSVKVLQAPSGRNDPWTSYAVPILVKETLDSQSANISSVSGVSYTSGGFISSLQSAIAQL